MYELFIEGRRADIDQKISILLSYAVDDINQFGSRNTSFSKTIVLPGTANNNIIFGHTQELGSFNDYAPGSANVDVNFNVAQTSKAEIKYNGLLMVKGVFRLTGIIKDGKFIEYEGSIFGELAGFAAAIGNSKLEDLDFSDHNHEYSVTNIIDSWDGTEPYYYPLIDYGNVSATISNKVDYKYTAFRTAVYVKQYIDKIFNNSGYTYESDFFNSALFESLIIPANVKQLQKLESEILATYLPTAFSVGVFPDLVQYLAGVYTNTVENLISYNGLVYTYTGTPASFNLTFTLSGIFYPNQCSSGAVQAFIYGEIVGTLPIVSQIYRGINLGNNQAPCGITSSKYDTTPINININITKTVTLNTNDELNFYVQAQNGILTVNSSTLTITAITPILAPLQIGDDVIVNNYIPKNIMQKDFFTWIMKMFNLYVDESKLDEKKLIIKPYVDYYDMSQYNDWTYKLARDKPLNITPMGMLNGRFIECKYKTDNDFYNESYQKKFNLSYGDRLFDTGFQFSKDSQKIEIGFSPTVLLQYDGTDKAVSAILKKSGGVGTTSEKEDAMDSNIRILYAKKITGVDAWDILDDDGTTVLENNLTEYGYAGHLDDPLDPTFDLNFGVPNEIYFEPNTLTTNNLFNTYWSGYIAEIADKDSKLLKCNIYLTHLDIAQLDFSIPVFIDGVTWRINKVEDYDATNNELVKVELLKIINNG